MPTIKINGINLYYERNGSGPTVVFLHGLGSLGADWQLQIPFFSNYFDVITPDLRGHGKSEKDGAPYEIFQLADDIAAMLKVLEISSAHIVGLSLGSFVAMELAINFPNLVRSLTLVGTTARVKNLGRFKLGLRSLLIKLLPMTQVAKIVAWSCFPDKEHAEFRNICTARISANNKNVYEALFNAAVRFDAESKLAKVHCPVLIISGKLDSLTPVTEAIKVHRQIPHSKHEVIATSYHVTPIDSPDAFNRLLFAFLNENE